MPGLGETAAALRRLRNASLTPDMTSRPGFAETAAFGENPGELRMLTYKPPSLKRGAPLLVVLHGCAQTAASYATCGGWRDLADRLGCAVLAPEQPSNNNFNRCFNWFSPDDTQRGRGEAASIAAMVKHALKAFGADPRQVYISGLSAGGAMAGVMLAAYPELFAGGGIIAGLPYGVAQSLPDAMRIMHRAEAWSSVQLGDLVRRAVPGGARHPLRLSIWHGDADWTVDRADGLAVAKQWANVEGLSETPDETTEFAKYSRSIWRGHKADDIAIEFNLVYDFGHGAPLLTTGPDGVGATAAFMLEAGVSSTLEMARFWGLLPVALLAPPSSQAAAAKPVKARARRRLTPLASPVDVGVGRQVLTSLAKVVPEDVTEVIAKAFKSAGLVKK